MDGLMDRDICTSRAAFAAEKGSKYTNENKCTKTPEMHIWQLSVSYSYLPISGVESVIGSMSPTIVEKIVIANRIVTPDK